MTKKILVFGHVDHGISSLLFKRMIEEHGDNIILVTPEEAKEQGLGMEDFANIPRMKISAPPIIPTIQFENYKTGKEQRRERRKKDRLFNKL
jgi:hypothetical protein